MKKFSLESANVFIEGVNSVFKRELAGSLLASEAMSEIKNIVEKGKEGVSINRRRLVKCARVVRNELAKSFSPFLNIFDDCSFQRAESKNTFLDYVCIEGNKLMALINWCHFWEIARPEWKVVVKYVFKG